jgi:hypothetical protein
VTKPLAAAQDTYCGPTCQKGSGKMEMPSTSRQALLLAICKEASVASDYMFKSTNDVWKDNTNIQICGKDGEIHKLNEE